MAGDPDDTVLIPRPGSRPRGRPGFAGFGLAWLAAGALVLATAGGAGWYAFHGGAGPAPPAVVALAPQPAPAPLPAPAVLPPLAGEAAILDRPAAATEAFRFELQPEIMVLQFASLAEQANALNRAAALIEKLGFPRDRVLDDAEMERRIRAGGATPDSFYYGHDYRAADLLRFFAEADRAGVPLTAGETWLRRSVDGWGWRDGTNAALISLVRDDPSSGLDRAARATILRHELSHGLYFVSPEYARYSLRFWQEQLTAAERAAFVRFLAAEGYDTAIEDLVVNETQAYLMHTPGERFFNARAVGLTTARLDGLRALFLTGMPPGWLRDCTVLPRRAPRRRRVVQRRGAVRMTRTAAESLAPPRAA